MVIDRQNSYLYLKKSIESDAPLGLFGSRDYILKNWIAGILRIMNEKWLCLPWGQMFFQKLQEFLI